MSFSIKYEIKEPAIRRLEFISKADGHLQILRMNPQWASLLERRARMMEAVSSIGIEGTVVSLDQAKAITSGEKGVAIGEKEKREFEGYYDSLEFIRSRVDEPLNIVSLLKIHEKITRGDTKASPGKVRTDIRSIKSRGKIIYTAPPPAHLDVLIREFIDWFNNVAEDKQISPIIAAAVCHFWFVWIHPFCDGNGRTGRLLTTYLLLKKKSEGIKYFALSDYYNTDKDSYYDALEKTNICNATEPALNFDKQMTLWLEYFIQSYQFQMDNLEQVTNRILQLNIRVAHLRQTGQITETHNKVLSFLSSRERASYPELVELLEVSKQRVHQILEPLRDAKILAEEKVGQLIWFKLGSPESELDEKGLKKRVKKKLNSNAVDNEKNPNEAVVRQGVLPIFE
ncbi:MAG: hypothetical protein RLY47_255 [Candidatus Parcubacteria bacterium]|jgi:Fic family protein